jgi:hypothetical protein
MGDNNIMDIKSVDEEACTGLMRSRIGISGGLL